MPEESAGHVSEEPLPHMLGTVCAVSPGPLQNPVCQRNPHSQTVVLLLSVRRLSWGGSAGRTLSGVAKKLAFPPLFFSPGLSH